MKKEYLILGYGNPDRGDDGVAFHILKELIKIYHSSPEALGEFNEVGLLELTQDVDIWYNLQLIPEVSQDIAEYENVIFIDAHTAEIPEPLLVAKVSPKYQNSPFTHHLTPASCLALAEKLYNSSPSATLITIRGYSFDFSNDLSPQTSELAKEAIEEIKKLVNSAE